MVCSHGIAMRCTVRQDFVWRFCGIVPVATSRDCQAACSDSEGLGLCSAVAESGYIQMWQRKCKLRPGVLPSKDEGPSAEEKDPLAGRCRAAWELRTSASKVARKRCGSTKPSSRRTAMAATKAGDRIPKA